MKDIRKLEKGFRMSADSALQQDFVMYLEVLFNQSLQELLRRSGGELMIEDRNILVGELRILKKIIEVLRPVGPMTYSVSPV